MTKNTSPRRPGSPRNPRGKKPRVGEKVFRAPNGQPLIIDPRDPEKLMYHDPMKGERVKLAPRKERRRLQRLNAKIAKERERAGLNKPQPVSDEEWDQ